MTTLLDILIQGALLGGLYALFAAGLSLMFGVMRLVNLAHGDIIVFAAFLIFAAGQWLGLSTLTGTLLAIPVLFVLGYLLQVSLLNRVLGRDILPPLLMTFGLSIIIQNGLLQGFSADSRRLPAPAIDTASVPLGGGLAVGLVPLLTFGTAVLVILGLNALFYRTPIGRAFRAVSDDAVTAQLMGIDNRRLFGIATGLALAVAALAGAWLGMRTNFDPSAGPARLIYAFEAVIIGGLGSFWGTLAGGIVLGVAQTAGAALNPEWQILAGHLVFLAILAVRPAGCSPAPWIERLAMTTTSVPVETARATGSRFHIETRTPLSTAAGIAALLIVLALAAAPLFAGRGLLQDLFFILTMLALAQYWNMLAGFAGLVSVGQQAFVGLGAYAMFALVIHAGLDPVLSIVLAGLFTGLIAVPVSFLVFRLHGAYFAIGTWVVAEVFRLLLAQAKSLGGGTGTALPKSATNNAAFVTFVADALHLKATVARDAAAYWLALVLAVGTIAIAYAVLRSRQGLALAAIRDNEGAARSVGVDAFRTKFWVFIIAAFGTGLVGALIYLQKARVSPDAAFSLLDWTANIIFIVVIGGIGTIEGPIVGVIVFALMQTWLSGFGAWYLILLGGLAIAAMLFFPRGLWGTLANRYDIALFPIRRRLSRKSTSRTANVQQPPSSLPS